MKLLELIQRESAVSVAKLSFIAVLAGLTQAMVLAIINSASQAATRGEDNFSLLLMFLSTLIGHILAQKYIMQRSTELVEGVLSNIRLRIADKIRSSELQAFERVGRSRIYSSVTKETITISQAAQPVIVACQSGIMVLFALIYLAWLSWAVFLVTVVLTIIGVSIHMQRARERRVDMQRALERENEFIDVLTHLLDGFKEVKMNTARSEDLASHLERVSVALRELKVRYGHQFAIHFIFSQAAFYVLIATIVFMLPQLAATSGEVVVKSTAAILFIVGPLSNLIGSVPAFASANVAAENIDALEEDLDKGREAFSGIAEIGTRPLIHPFNEIEFDKVRFHYLDKNAVPTFSLGPIDLRCARARSFS